MSFFQCLTDALPALLNPTGRLTVEAAQEQQSHSLPAPVQGPDRHQRYCMEPPPAYPGCACTLPHGMEYAEPVAPTPYYDDLEMDAKQSGVLQQLSHSIESEVTALSSDLRELSLKMWDNPELQWKEFKTHDLFTSFFEKNLAHEGWVTTRHAHGVETAFECKYEFFPPGFNGPKEEVRCIGFQSELDALPGIGHGCGHNLIAISGVASAVSLARACKANNIPVKVILLGTPAEEGGGGKISLIQGGAYDQMSVCLMCHPALSNTVTPMLAVQALAVRFKGKTAHAAAAPWQGINALDAAVLAYNNISSMRQQLPPSSRVHGIIEGNNMAPNVIPNDVQVRYNVRGPAAKDVKANLAKILPCFEGAAKATGCSYEITMVCCVLLAIQDVSMKRFGLTDSFDALSQNRTRCTTMCGSVPVCGNRLNPSWEASTICHSLRLPSLRRQTLVM